MIVCHHPCLRADVVVQSLAGITRGQDAPGSIPTFSKHKNRTQCFGKCLGSLQNPIVWLVRQNIWLIFCAKPNASNGSQTIENALRLQSLGSC